MVSSRDSDEFAAVAAGLPLGFALLSTLRTTTYTAAVTLFIIYSYFVFFIVCVRGGEIRPRLSANASAPWIPCPRLRRRRFSSHTKVYIQLSFY